jgi:hypothetical protein
MRSRRDDEPSPASLRWALAGGALLLLGACGGGNSVPTGIIPGMAVAKFCHQLSHNGAPTTLTLEVGDKTHFTTINALTGTCQPPAGQPCATVPVGLVELRIKEADNLLATRQVILHDGQEYLVQPGVNSADGTLGIGGGPLLNGRCINLDFLPLDGGVGDGGGDGAIAGEAGVADGGVADAAADASAPDAGALDVAIDAPAADLASDVPVEDAASPIDGATD